MQIDTRNLKKARDQLNESLTYYRSDLAKQDGRLAFQFRSAAIQAFEYTYELAIKMLKRHLREFESDEIIQQSQYRDLIRMGAIHGLVEEPTEWFRFRELRNLTSHTYDESKASEVAAHLDDFLRATDRMLDAFERLRNVEENG